MKNLEIFKLATNSDGSAKVVAGTDLIKRVVKRKTKALVAQAAQLYGEMLSVKCTKCAALPGQPCFDAKYPDKYIMHFGRYPA